MIGSGKVLIKDCQGRIERYILIDIGFTELKYLVAHHNSRGVVAVLYRK